MSAQLFLSGGASNTDPSLSIGGAKSSVRVAPREVFSPLTAADYASGKVRYRLLYAEAGETLEDFRLFLQDPPSDVTYSLGWAAANVNETEDAIANESTAPAGVSFSSPSTYNDAPQGPDLDEGDYKGVWVKEEVAPGTTPASEVFRIRGATASPLWTPADEDGLIAWFDLSDPDSFNTTSKEWAARFGAGTFLPDDAGPSRITNGFSGNKAALLFDGSVNHGLYMENPGAAELMVVVAMNVTEAKPGVYPVVWNRGVLGIQFSGLQLLETYGAQANYRNGDKAENYSLSLPGQVLAVSRHTTAARTLRLNGAHADEKTSTASGTAPHPNDTFELCRYIDTGTDWTVQIAAVGLFAASAWSTALAQRIEGFICHNQLGHTTALLPGGHPYKTNPPLKV